MRKQERALSNKDGTSNEVSDSIKPQAGTGVHLRAFPAKDVDFCIPIPVSH